MFRPLRRLITKWRFERAWARSLRQIEDARRKHGRVREAEERHRQALHRALAGKAVQS